MNTGYYGTKKPHLFYNRALKKWICFHWGQGYIYGDSMRAAYTMWLCLTGLINKIGAVPTGLETTNPKQPR